LPIFQIAKSLFEISGTVASYLWPKNIFVQSPNSIQSLKNIILCSKSKFRLQRPENLVWHFGFLIINWHLDFLEFGGIRNYLKIHNFFWTRIKRKKKKKRNSNLHSCKIKFIKKIFYYYQLNFLWDLNQQLFQYPKFLNWEASTSIIIDPKLSKKIANSQLKQLNENNSKFITIHK
jgi:hypothetical protein